MGGGIKKKAFTKQRQYEIMIEFMVKHPDLAKGHLKVPEGKSKSKNLWQRLCLDLDAAGPPAHDVKGWKKVWADYKNHLKNKVRLNRSSISGTGGGPSKYCSLTQLEQQTAELLSMQEAVNGMNGTLEFGAKTLSKTGLSTTENINNENNVTTRDEADTDSDISIEEDSSEESIPHRPKRKEKAFDKDSLLRKQVENQILYQQNSIKIHTEINQNLAGVQKYLKRSFEIQDRRYKLEKDKFKFDKEKFELEKEKYELKKAKFNFKKKEEYFKSKRKIEHLELKKRFFELQEQKHQLSK